jgi:NTP pyrophosphatase (non-canonical NTP hydrolase)
MMNKIEEFNVDEYIDKVTETKRIFRQSLEKYGKEAQSRQAMEECAELVQAINKCLRYPNKDDCKDNLVEEIADVEIMLYQLKVMFNIDDDQVFAFKVEKAKREQERLKKL